MKKTLFILFVILALTVSALEIREADEVIVDETINENLFAAGGSVSIEAEIKGDITAFGGSINVNSPAQDIMLMGGSVSVNAPTKGGHACGGDVSINGAVDGDLLSGGGSISVNSDVNGDIRMFGGSISINGAINGDVLAMGGSISLNGPVAGDVAVTAGQLSINSIIEGDVDATTEKIKLGKDAVIKGNLIVSSEAQFAGTKEQIMGSITKKEPKALPKFDKTAFIIFGALAYLLLGIVFVLIFPKTSNKLADNIKKKPWHALLYGLIALIVTPIAAVIIMITIIGIPIGIILIILYILTLVISGIFTSLYLGKLITKQKKPVWPVVVGMVILTVLTLIPVVGPIIKFVAVLLGLGTIAMWIFKKKK